MDLDPKKRLEKIKPENELVKTASVSGLITSYDLIEEAKTVISMSQENTNDFVDTEVSYFKNVHQGIYQLSESGEARLQIMLKVGGAKPKIHGKHK